MKAAQPRFRSRARAGFSLVELLVVVAIIALLISMLLPSLASSREAARSSVCFSNLRQSAVACRQYADENRGVGPAIGQPYTSLPTWALVVQALAGHTGSSADQMYNPKSVLVCPTIARAYSEQAMVRTYAMNATGHAGQPGDPDNYDDVNQPAFIRLDRIPLPAATPLLLDSDVPPPTTTNPPPPTRTASMIDFRQSSHLQSRIGWFHSEAFNVAMIDQSVHRRRVVDPGWSVPLP